MPRDDTRIYVGNLPADVRERDVEDIFSKYGKIKFVDVKGGRGPCFAFVEFDDSRDADDAVRGRDGYDFDGHRLRVEFTRGVGPRGPGGRPLNPAYGGSRDFGGSRRGGGPPARRTNYRVIIEGLPPTGSWQDLKDHMREAGDVCYADVARDGTGVVEFTHPMREKLHIFAFARIPLAEEVVVVAVGRVRQEIVVFLLVILHVVREVALRVVLARDLVRAPALRPVKETLDYHEEQTRDASTLQCIWRRRRDSYN
ncbi:unnamed protein product [Caenorhabditis auriculariae]|uniref:RRM domain-containing protein n=1 Tax=Caenorhabditis auriculariae TaxID=2777116 RepID=A0A8S1HQ15_9PELO|nr:unnamed protein product [Caenorhabditis auriculariae]